MTTTTHDHVTRGLSDEDAACVFVSADGSVTIHDPAHVALENFDPTAPVFEVWINGRRYACTQIPARAFRLVHDMHEGRPNKQPPELRIVNDRRSVAR